MNEILEQVSGAFSSLPMLWKSLIILFFLAVAVSQFEQFGEACGRALFHLTK